MLDMCLARLTYPGQPMIQFYYATNPQAFRILQDSVKKEWNYSAPASYRRDVIFTTDASKHLQNASDPLRSRDGRYHGYTTKVFNES